MTERFTKPQSIEGRNIWTKEHMKPADILPIEENFYLYVSIYYIVDLWDCVMLVMKLV